MKEILETGVFIGKNDKAVFFVNVRIESERENSLKLEAWLAHNQTNYESQTSLPGIQSKFVALIVHISK